MAVKRIRDLRRRSKSGYRNYYMSDNLKIYVTTQPSKNNKVKREKQ